MRDLLTVAADLAHAELDQVIGLKFAARPAISLLELDSEEIVDLDEFAVFDTSRAAVIRELDFDNGIGRDGLFNFKAGPRSRNIFQNGPLRVN